MIKDFIKECLEQAKEEYFKTDHHFHGNEEAKDAEWTNLLKRMDRDFFDEWIDPVIEKEDKDLWDCSNKFMLYMLTKEVVGEV